MAVFYSYILMYVLFFKIDRQTNLYILLFILLRVTKNWNNEPEKLNRSSA